MTKADVHKERITMTEERTYRILLTSDNGEREMWLTLTEGDPTNDEKIQHVQQRLNEPINREASRKMAMEARKIMDRGKSRNG